LLLSVGVGPFGQDGGRVFGVRFVDEETRAAREVERVGTAGVVGYDLGGIPAAVSAVWASSASLRVG
jgi:hypothetical protein